MNEQTPERVAVFKAGAARCAEDRWRCWFCGACIPRGAERVVVESEDVQARRRGRFYVKGAEGLAMSCGCTCVQAHEPICGQVYEQRSTGAKLRVIHVVGGSVLLAPVEWDMAPLVSASFDELRGTFRDISSTYPPHHPSSPDEIPANQHNEAA